MGENKEEKIKELMLLRFEAVSKFKSVKRAWRRGHISDYGFIYPKRPFNNRKRTDGREMQITKERIYGQLTGRSQAN